MSTNLAALFEPGWNKMFNIALQQYSPQCFDIFHDTPMTGRYLNRLGWQTYGPPQITDPLNAVHMDEVRPSFQSSYAPIKRTLGDLLAEEDYEDDEYGFCKRVIASRAGAMAEIFVEKREYDCFNYLAITGFSSTSPCPHSPDGVSLFNTAHPISLYNSSTTVSNIASSPTQLSNTAYYAAYAVMTQQFAPNNYTIIRSRPTRLLYNPTQRAVAVQIAKGDWERAQSTQAFQGLMNAAKMDNLKLVESPHYRRTLATSAANSLDSWCLFGENRALVFANRQGYRAKSDYSINQLAYVFVGYIRYDIGHDTYLDSYSGG